MSHDARFSIIPGWVVTHPDIKGADLKVLCLLGRHVDKAGWCRRSQVKMAVELNAGRSTVQGSLNRLIGIGAVEKHEATSADGRDSAHYYRLIFDRVPDGVEQCDDDKEFAPISPSEGGLTPAGIVAPPAGIVAGGATLRAAPPAASGAAPIKDPCLTTPSEPERENASASKDDLEENPRSVVRKFEKWWPTYPGYAGTSHDAALREWQAMTAAERAECIDKSPAFIAAAQAAKSAFVWPSVYLRERKWRLMDDPKSEYAPPSMHNAFSRAWMAKRLAELLKPMTVTGWPVPTITQQRMMRDADKAREIEMERRARYGWPKVTDMHSKAENAQGVTVPGPLLSISESFVKMHRDSEEAAAWKALHDRMGWPWLPETRHEWLYFPAGEPGAAMQELKARLDGTAERASDDAA